MQPHSGFVNMAAYMIHASANKNILIASGDIGSRGLNPKQIESYELFSDGAAAVVLSSASSESQGIIASAQRTWPQYAHDVEIRGGLSGLHPENYSDMPEDFMFDMNGIAALRAIARVVPEFFRKFQESSGTNIDDYEVVIPHQASSALSLLMRMLDIPDDKYINWVNSHGNLISASVPYILCELLSSGRLSTNEGKKVLLCGTAAGLSANIVALEL